MCKRYNQFKNEQFSLQKSSPCAKDWKKRKTNRIIINDNKVDLVRKQKISLEKETLVIGTFLIIKFYEDNNKMKLAD